MRLPLVGRLIPIVADSYSDPEKGSGAVKITPAHDFNDFEVGARHKLPLINILDAEARVILRENEAFLEGVIENDDLSETLDSLHGLIARRCAQGGDRRHGGARPGRDRSRRTSIRFRMATAPAW